MENRKWDPSQTNNLNPFVDLTVFFLTNGKFYEVKLTI